MKRINEQGSAASIIVIALLSVLVVASLGFAFWAYAGRQDYKNNVDAKVSTAVEAAKQAEDTKRDAANAEANKSPLRAYNGPQAFGSIVINYPKTWSGYVNDGDGSSSPIDGYFSPNVVPSVTAQNSVFALRVKVVAASYSQTLQAATGQGQTVKPYALPKVPSVVGVMVTGSIGTKTGTMVILPLRDKTLEIYTEGSQYLNDFNTYILPNASFSP